MSDITYLDTERRTMRAIEYRRALRLSDPGQRRDECRRIAAEHRAETAASQGPSVGPVRPARPRLLTVEAGRAAS